MLPRKTSVAKKRLGSRDTLISSSQPDVLMVVKKQKKARPTPKPAVTPDAQFKHDQSVAGDTMTVEMKRIGDKVVCVATDEYLKEYRLELDPDDVISRTGARRINDVNQEQLRKLAPLLDMKADKVRRWWYI